MKERNQRGGAVVHDVVNLLRKPKIPVSVAINGVIRLAGW